MCVSVLSVWGKQKSNCSNFVQIGMFFWDMFESTLLFKDDCLTSNIDKVMPVKIWETRSWGIELLMLPTTWKCWQLNSFVVKSANIQISQPTIGAVVKGVPHALGASSMLVCVSYINFFYFRAIGIRIPIMLFLCSMFTQYSNCKRFFRLSNPLVQWLSRVRVTIISVVSSN